MRYKIEFKPRAIKDIKSFSQDESRRIIKKIETLQDNLSGDVKRLTDFSPEYRLRVGDYRILFEIENDTIVIYRVKHRREVYRK